jgi:RNA polymerase sigma-70 factor, ECF subfamily
MSATADTDAEFQKLVEAHRGELHAHCYRMTGSVHDADDALQDATLRAWRALDQYARRSTFRAWLYAIVTNTCLNVIRSRPIRVLPLDYGPSRGVDDDFGLPPLEALWVEPYPDVGPEATFEQRESIELAFVAALQYLPANQRAALILREVLGFPAKEVASMLDTSAASVNSALQRARATLDSELPDRSQQATLQSLGDDELSRIVGSYVDALEAGDVDEVVALLAADVAWSMPPLPAWFTGDALRRFMAEKVFAFRWRHVPLRVNGQPAVARYAWHPEHDAFLPFGIDSLTLDGARISAITTFIARSTESREQEYYDRWPERPVDLDALAAWFARFGLPARAD